MNPEERKALVLNQIRRNMPELNMYALEDEICSALREQSEEFHHQIRDDIWRLLTQGVLAPGPSGAISKNGLPHLRVTEYGKVVLQEQEANPYNGFSEYVRCLKRKMEQEPELKFAAIDSIVLNYMFEALEVFQGRFWNSAAVMLGVATERCIHMLAECLLKNRHEEVKKFNLEKIGSQSAEYRTKLNRALQSLHLDIELDGKRETYLGSLSDTIMWSRNTGGHPKKVSVDRNDVFIHLQLFQAYLVWVYKVIAAISPRDILLNPDLESSQTIV